MISPTSIENASDSDLWTLVCQGRAEAFEVILRRVPIARLRGRLQ